MVVEGIVQGVGFRWFVARHAEALGLHGYVKNFFNGNVEVVAEGDRSLVEELIKEVKVGPRSAHISNVWIEWERIPSGTSSPQFSHFEIR